MAVDRFSVTLDPELGKAVRAAAEAEGVTISAWVADAVGRQVRQKALREALDEWKAEMGPFSAEEIAAADAFLEDAEREAREKALEHETKDRERAERGREDRSEPAA